MTYTVPPLRRFARGEIAYLRVRVIDSTEDGAAVTVVDMQSREVDGWRRYVDEGALVSRLDLLKAVKGMG